MKNLFLILKQNLPEIKAQLLDFHDIAFDVLSFKNLRSWAGMLSLTIAFYLGLSLTGQLIGIFFIFYFLDFFTGFLASKVQLEKKKAANPNLESPPYLIQSNKIIRGGVKLSAYLVIFLLGYFIELIVKSPNVNLHSSIIELTPLQIAVIVAIASEVVSNFENSKTAGLDIIGGLTGFAKTIWRLFNAIKNKPDESK
jgi:hypothetical protein